MKKTMTALAVVILAGAMLPPPAYAAPGDERRAARVEQRDRPQRDGASRDFGGRRQAPAARQAPQAPQAPRAAEPRRNSGGEVVQGQRSGERRDWAGRGEGRRGDGDRRGDGGRRDWDRDGRRGAERQGGDRRDWAGRDGRRDSDRRDRDRREWDGRRGDDRRWDRRDHRADNRRWEHGRYPRSYYSPQRYRYRHAWRPPVGFYVHVWNYGDFLPRGWWGPDWWIADPWYYDLPLPPPGFNWVRVGDDALLVDEWTGRVVQVVRDVFW